jgi:hypothetical protein
VGRSIFLCERKKDKRGFGICIAWFSIYYIMICIGKGVLVLLRSQSTDFGFWRLIFASRFFG